MRTSAEFLSDLQPILDRIAGGPMDTNSIDVLAVMARAESYCFNSPLNGALDAANSLTEARTTVAELIAAASEARDLLAGWDGLSRNNAANLAAESADRLAAALARIGATP